MGAFPCLSRCCIHVKSCDVSTSRAVGETRRSLRFLQPPCLLLSRFIQISQIESRNDTLSKCSRRVFTLVSQLRAHILHLRRAAKGTARAPGRRTVVLARTRPRLMHSGSSIALACTPLRPRQSAPRGYLMKKGGRSDDADDQPRPMHIKQFSCEGWKVYRNRFVIELSPYHNVIGVRRHPTAQPRGCPLITCSHSLSGLAPPQWERTAPERATSSRASSSCSSTSHRI